jgi:hypothetical protein
VKSFLTLAALTIGPLAGWLMWAVLNRRPYHAVLALTANLVLWLGGGAFVLHFIHWSHP